MALKRATKVNAVVIVPVSDDDWQRQWSAHIARASHEARNRALAEVPRAPADQIDAACLEAARAEASRLQAVVDRFNECLDMAVLSTDFDLPAIAKAGVAGLSGAQFADAEAAADLAGIRGDKSPRGWRVDVETVRRGLRMLEGFSEGPTDGLYPIDVLAGPGGVGEAYAGLIRELAEHIRTWSHLGE